MHSAAGKWKDYWGDEREICVLLPRSHTRQPVQEPSRRGASFYLLVYSFMFLKVSCYLHAPSLISGFFSLFDPRAPWRKWGISVHTAACSDLATSRTNQAGQLWPGNRPANHTVPLWPRSHAMAPWHGNLRNYSTCLCCMSISRQPPVTSLVPLVKESIRITRLFKLQTMPVVCHLLRQCVLMVGVHLSVSEAFNIFGHFSFI